MNKNSVDKGVLLINILSIIEEAKSKGIFSSGDYIFVKAKTLQPELTIWVCSKMISDLVKKGAILKIKVGNKFKYVTIEKENDMNTKDKYISIIKKCHQIEENVLKLMQAENDGVKDLSNIVDELNNVVNKLN